MSQRYRDPQDDIGNNPNPLLPIGEIIEARLSRRGLFKGLLAGAAVLTLPGVFARNALAAATQASSSLGFTEIAHGIDETHHVAPGYRAEVLIRWGDPLVKGLGEFDPRKLSADEQERRFGYNNDYIAFMPLEGKPDHGLLCVNHEYTVTHLMFPGLSEDKLKDQVSAEQTQIELAAHGHSVVEVRKVDGRWRYVPDSPYNRRITMRSTEIMIAGPAAGHERLKTKADPSGRKVIGTLNNCAGGKTPWGTVLIAEENFHQYFAGDPKGTPEEKNHRRYGIKGEPEYPWWGKHVARFDIAQEPNEPNRFGWIVEYDPYDPRSVPVKRTALGRFKHEGAAVVLNPDGRVVVYSGDDERFDYIYKFVSKGKYDKNDRKANFGLLDEGTLYVARFSEDKLTWLPLVHGQGPLTQDNGFASQADVLIETRRAADLLGATPMDRPEDIEAHPKDGKVYVALTNNAKRETDKVDAVNPRAKNETGHILALSPPGGDHAAGEFTWDIAIRAGDPRKPEAGAKYHPAVSENGWFWCPDNLAVDGAGRLWIATDQGAAWQKSGTADGMWACDTQGAGAYLTRFFFRVPIGAEMCGPEFTPDDRTLFLAVQHPAADGVKDSTFDKPATRWPDFKEGMPPRPSVVAIVKDDGGIIGA
ncbi:MAG TPA: PhoX family phosphatase [Candidatus Competibacteraceae bacterium]|nr:PhoX family phosphatase [Candidatus Competibacteraceae bacterium]